MYHYVRPIKGSKFPGIKGLELDGFKQQLDYLTENFNIVSTEKVINAAKHSSPLPNNACWLTFDDGYKDHFKFVMPELLNCNSCTSVEKTCRVVTKLYTCYTRTMRWL